MANVNSIVSDEELDDAWGNSNFGGNSKRDVIANTLLKCASGYESGKTAKAIVENLGLVKLSKWTLTKKGKEYLYEAFKIL